MRYFEQFMKSKNFTFEEKEERRVADYYKPGSVLEKDKVDYIAWLEDKVASAQKDMSL